ncbi:MAG: S8 family serine peptidase [Bacteroidota bacterium]|nr:S8 family serine peptidase [Bacteroidota bacterium]
MRSVVPILALLMLFVLAGSSVAKEVERPSSRAAVKDADIVPGLVFIKLKQQHNLPPGATRFGISGVDRILQRVGARSVEALHPTLSLRKGYASAEEASLARIMLVRYDSEASPQALATELARDPAVEYAEPYYHFRPLNTPDDPRFSSQWALATLKMEEAWDITTGDSTVVIGYIDSGINYNHEDLQGSLYINPGEWGTSGELKDNGVDDDGNGYVDDWRGWDFIGNGTTQSPAPDNDPMDFDGHGTSGAAIAAARTNNGKGIAGVGYNTKILALKAQDDANTTGIAGYNAIRYAVDMGCKVINASWGSNAPLSQVLQDEIDYAHANGVLVVGGAGNNAIDNDINPFIPASLNHVLSVSSIEQSGDASTWAAFGSSVHVYAPGTDIVTARMSFGYHNVTGTSFSAPHMSGLAALVFAVHPDWTPDQVKQQIRVTADMFGTAYEAPRYGRANAYKALSLNETMSDVPGLAIKSFTVSSPTGSTITEAGQEVSVEVVIENLLAPTSDAQVSWSVDPIYGTVSSSSAALGAMQTMETKTVNFNFTLDENTTLSEGYIPVVFSFTDGTYMDFDMDRLMVYLEDEIHTVLDLRYPYNSIDAPDRWTVWVAGDFTENNVPTQDIAIRSSDGGDSWLFAFGNGYPNGEGVYCIDGVDEFTALVGTGPVSGNAGVFLTTDGGQSWSGTSVATMTPFVNWIHMFNQSDGIFQGDPKDGVWGIARTTNGGMSWTPIATPLTAASGEAGWNNSYDFVNENVGWFGTNSSIIYKTVDGGNTWTSHPTPSKNSIDISFRDELVGAARFSRQADQGTDTLALSTDGGETWSIISNLIVPFGSIVWERGGERLWVFTDGNAYSTTDIGATWAVQPVPSDFNFISDAAEWNDGFVSKVFAAGIEVFRYTSPHRQVVSVDAPGAPLPQALAIDALYPQPASAVGGSLTAQISIANSAAVTLALYDMSGRKLRDVFSATLHAGSHSARMSTTGLAAGSYILRMTAGSATVSQPVRIIN